MDLFFPRNSPSQEAPYSKQRRFHPTPPHPHTHWSLSIPLSCIALFFIVLITISFTLHTTEYLCTDYLPTGMNPRQEHRRESRQSCFIKTVCEYISKQHCPSAFFHFLDFRDLCAATGSVISMKTWLNLVNNNKYNQSKWPWNLRINSGINTAQNAELACFDSLMKHWQSKPQDMLYFTKKGAPGTSGEDQLLVNHGKPKLFLDCFSGLKLKSGLMLAKLQNNC